MNETPTPGRDFADPRIPDRDACVTRYLLDRWARERGEKVHIVYENGEAWTFADTRTRVIKVAAGLQKLGVRRGDRVAVWLPNGREATTVFYAINYLGAVFVPLNTAYRGNLLAHVVANSEARLIVAHPDLSGRLAEIDRAALTHVVLTGTKPVPDVGLDTSRYADLDGGESDLLPLATPIQPWDLQSIIYTSGTTGPSKGVLSSYLHLFSNAGPEAWPMVTEDDRYMTASPIFHMGGMGPPFVMLARGGSVAIVENFSTDRFWEIVRATQSTVLFLLGVMATFLIKRPPAASDRDHGARLAFIVPFTEDASKVRERFGMDVYTIFNMTEINSPIVSAANPTQRGTCGRRREGVDVRLVDAHDCEVPVGTVGEMIIRSDRPWGLNSGYNNNPEATAKAWANGWFHTGDAFRQDAEGNFYFVDRVKDAIRRRGENISSFEVESEVCAHPDVQEAAAIGVPSEFSEDEVMVVLAAIPGRSLDLPALVQFLAERMPAFMVPRYIRVMDALPKTPSAKVLKVDLRRVGVTPDTWDREKEGIRLRRHVLS